ncbi:MAG: 4Fe-4S cluster-binding domain-containing protein [Coriobacteriia bacterium]|nr:4Fe-4S cluster-binding domain-containing protein [Coriobacteriia bacterium]
MNSDFLLTHDLHACELCPIMCKTNRYEKPGAICRAGSKLRIARAALHFWEEPPLSGKAGSGTIFFSHCTMKCAYCQNYEISHDGFGVDISEHRLYEIFYELKEQGALNINLVTPSHFADAIARVIKRAKADGFDLPIVYNTSAYERQEAIVALRDLVDIWLADYRYADNVLAQKYSRTRDYPEYALKAIEQMKQNLEDRGGRLLNVEGIMQRGLIVRHLILPNQVEHSLEALQRLYDTFGADLELSIMNQFTPVHSRYQNHDELKRSVSAEEYERVLDFADDLGFEQYYWQDGPAMSESFIPPFDKTGV